MGARSVAVLVITVAVAGCSSNNGSGTPPKQSTPVVTSDRPQMTTSSAVPTSPTTPSSIISAFKRAGLPVGSIYKVTAANDPNHLLGRPNGYVAKEAWTDTRVRRSDASDSTPGAVDLGGAIEQFNDQAGAEQRKIYIQTVEKSVGFLDHEYDFVVGDCLIRISALLTPKQAQAYAQAARG